MLGTIVKCIVLFSTGNSTVKKKRLCRVPKIIKIPASGLKGSFLVCFSSSPFHVKFVDLSWDPFVGYLDLLTQYKMGLNGLGFPFGKWEYRERDGEMERWRETRKRGRKKLVFGDAGGQEKVPLSLPGCHCCSVLSHGAGGKVAWMNFKLRHEMT